MSESSKKLRDVRNDSSNGELEQEKERDREEQEEMSRSAPSAKARCQDTDRLKESISLPAETLEKPTLD